MKGLSETIIIVITVVVILVAALVVLTIFGSGIQNVSSLAQAETMCLSEAQISCAAGTYTTANPTATWNSPTKRLPDGTVQSCSQVVKCTMSCSGVTFSCQK